MWIDNHRLAKILKGKTLVHLSDLHMSKIGAREEKVLNILTGLKPDIIFLTGDYVPWRRDYEPALTFLSKLKAKIGVWAVMGDYDYSHSRKSCLFCHEPRSGKLTRRHGVRFLRNVSEQVVLDGGSMWIGGIDKGAVSPFVENEHFFPERATAPVILLSHSPSTFDLLDEDQEVLILAGDTHEGQIPLPSWLWKILGYEKNARYNQGHLEEGRKKVFVSRGIGTSHLPFRFMRRPEVVVLHFR